MHKGRGGAYRAHEALLKQARARPELWRLLSGLTVVAVIVVASNLLLIALLAGLVAPGQSADLLSATTPTSLLILLASFGIITLSVAIAAHAFQHRNLASILGVWPTALQQFWRVLRALILLAVVMSLLPPYSLGEPLQPNLNLSIWLIFLPLSLIAVLIQTSAEEVLFRGYLQQSLAARFRSPVIWIGLPSLLFAAGHYAPASTGDNALLVAVWACVFGLLAADLTARAGTLGPAIALHFFNNVVALLFVALPDSLSGLALYLLPFDMSDTNLLRQWLYVDFGVMIVCWLTARLALRR